MPPAYTMPAQLAVLFHHAQSIYQKRHTAAGGFGVNEQCTGLWVCAVTCTCMTWISCSPCALELNRIQSISPFGHTRKILSPTTSHRGSTVPRTCSCWSVCSGNARRRVGGSLPLVDLGRAETDGYVQGQRLSERPQDGIALAPHEVPVPRAVHGQGASQAENGPCVKHSSAWQQRHGGRLTALPQDSTMAASFLPLSVQCAVSGCMFRECCCRRLPLEHVEPRSD